MILQGFRGKVDVQSIKEYIRKEYCLPAFDSYSTNIIDEVEMYKKDDETLMHVSITNRDFIADLHNDLKRAHRLFAIPVELPHFSDESSGDLSYKYIKKRYPNLSFMHLPYYQTQTGVTITYYYALSDANLAELEEFYPEVLV